jgi:signal transduction histidine kinase
VNQLRPTATESTAAPGGFARFRAKLLVAMMLVVTAATALALFFAQRNVADNVRRDFARQFQSELAALHALQEVRHAALAERCRSLARKPRIHAALEDGALDLLYPSARDELSDMMDAADPEAPGQPKVFHTRFYRFLDSRGAVIPPASERDGGALTPAETAQLALRALPATAQGGYLWRSARTSGETLDEVLAMPIVSSETGEIIAALVLGFRPGDPAIRQADATIKSGIWTGGRLQLSGFDAPTREALAVQLQRGLTSAPGSEHSYTAKVGGVPYLLFSKLLNPGSSFPPAYEVCLCPLTDSVNRQRRLFWQFAGAGTLLLAGAFVASRILARRLSVPVERLAVDSEQNRAERARAEAALELTSEELQRSVRFSADASHQLKTPVTVLRAGLEELLAGEKLTGEVREEVSALVHQTFRLTSVIEDLLLLSRMDAGRLRLELAPLDLIPLVEGWLDDLGALPEAPGLAVETDFPPVLYILGEKRYTTLILQNLLENARKYNRSGGRLRIAARAEEGWAVLTVGNTGAPIPPAAREHIFERFHRGAMGENIPGHGLGLNLARELARLHQGDLRLARSDDEWTEFEARFRLVEQPAVAGPVRP